MIINPKQNGDTSGSHHQSSHQYIIHSANKQNKCSSIKDGYSGISSPAKTQHPAKIPRKQYCNQSHRQTHNLFQYGQLPHLRSLAGTSPCCSRESRNPSPFNVSAIPSSFILPMSGPANHVCLKLCLPRVLRR